MGLLASVGRAGFSILVLAWSAIFASAAAIGRAAVFGCDFVRSRWAMRGGRLHCPKGHIIVTEGETYCCGSCGFTYGGPSASIWECGNPECRAVTPYVDCPDCGRSRRNPYRWGRP